MQEEIWKDIPGYEGLYRISTEGNIWSYRTKSIHSQRKKIASKRQLPYCETALTKDNKQRFHFVHRLSLITFKGPPPSDKHIGMHENDIPFDNRIVNLKWGTQKENVNDCMNKGRFIIDILRLKRIASVPRKNQRKILITKIDTKEMFEVNSTRLAASVTKISLRDIIDVLNGRKENYKNYSFKYLDYLATHN